MAAAKKSTTDRGTSARCYKKEVELKLGPIGFSVNLFPPRRSHSDDLISLCPTCLEEAKTQYYCTEHDDHGPFGYSDIVRGVEAGEPVATAEEIKAVKNVDEDQNFNVLAYPAADIEANTYPVGTPYVLRPVGGKPAPLYPLVMAKISSDGRINVGKNKVITLVGEIELRGKMKLMQLRTWHGHLVAQELCRPQDLHEFQELDLAHDQRFEKFVDESLELIEADFDADEFEDQARKRVAEFTAAALAGGGDVIALPVRDDKPDDDMFAALEASIAIAKKKAKAS